MRAIFVMLSVAMWIGMAAGTKAAVLPRWDFEQNVAGWLTLDKEGQIARETEAAHVREGTGSLRFHFRARPAADGDLPGFLAVPLAGGVAGAQALHLALKSSVSGLVALALREADESNYMLLLYIGAEEWHELDLPLSCFRLDENSQDENGRLDGEQINAFVLADPGIFLEQAVGQGGVPFFFMRPPERTIWLDDVRFEESLCQRLSAPELPGAVMIEDCDRDTAYFAILGGQDLKASLCADPAIRGKSLRLDYTLPANTLLAALCQIASGALAGTSGFTFAVRSGAPITLLALAEEEDRSRYQQVIEIPAGRWERPQTRWAEMTLTDDTRDPDTGLQPEIIRSIAFVDLTALLGQKETANTLWLDEITSVP